MEPAGEAQGRETPTHLETHENVRVEESGLMWREAKDTDQNRVRRRALVVDLCSIRNEEEK